MNSTEESFFLAMLVMAVVTYGCRLAGYWLGRHLRNDAAVGGFWDLLPVCALAAVIGPRLADMDFGQTIGLGAAVLVFLATSRFLLALGLGALLLMVPEL